MSEFVLSIVAILLKIAYFPFKLLKVKNKIVYISRESNKENIDFKLIREEMESKYPEFENVVLTKKIEEGIIDKIKYIGEIYRQMYHIATSKIVIIDTYCITVSVLKHKKETKIIQIWHALGAIKKFGYQSIDKPSGRKASMAKAMHMHENYDYVLAPSRETAKYYKEAFNVNDNQIEYLGMPRIDYLLKEDDKMKEKIYNTYPILKEKTNIIYVPTFRKGEKVELDDLVEKINTDKYNLIIKLHPLDLKEYSYKEKNGVIYETKFSTYDLLKISDRMITDYSSLAIDAGILNIPLYFYIYDIDKYKFDPGVNFDFEHEKIGKYQATNAKKLVELINEDYDYNVLEDFRKKYVEINTKDCANQLVKFMMRLVNNEEIKNDIDESIKEKLNI